jgi:HNH endonuclease
MDEEVRQFVRQRAENRCEYCRLAQQHAPVAKFHVEHIRARQHRGDDTPENLCLACPRCNRFKGPNLTTYDPKTNEKVDVFNPRTDTWSEHFEFDSIYIIGSTPMGRGTVELLQMNAGDRLDVRMAQNERGELN